MQGVEPQSDFNDHKSALKLNITIQRHIMPLKVKIKILLPMLLLCSLLNLPTFCTAFFSKCSTADKDVPRHQAISSSLTPPSL